MVNLRRINIVKIDDINDLKKIFAEKNQIEWKQETDCKNKGNILLYVATHDITALIDAMLFSKKLSIENKYKLFIGLDEPTDSSTCSVYKSFCIDGFINMYITNWFMKIYCFIISIYLWFGINKSDDILKIQYMNIPIGEDLYDSIIRTNLDIYTVDKIDVKCLKAIYGCVMRMQVMNSIIQKNHIDTFVYSDGDYERNMFFKLALKYNLAIYQVNGGNVYRHKERFNYKEITPDNINLQRYRMYQNTSKEEINEFLDKHFSGRREGFLDAVAYRKNEYTREKLFKKFNISVNDYQNVLVAAHAFSDRPHYGRDMLYRDYYQWLVETIKILANVREINVFVKEHPSAKFYGEQGSIKHLCSLLNIDNIYIIPDDCSTISMFQIMDVVVTCQGTIGIEAVIHGIPVVTASKGYYYGFGIDNNASSIEEYTKLLNNLRDLPVITYQQRDVAKRLLYISSKVFSDLHPHIYGKNRMHGKTQLEKYQCICEKKYTNIPLKDNYYNSILNDIIIYFDDMWNELEHYRQEIYR